MTSESLYIGTAGWSYKDWESIVYPDSLPKSADRLTYYSNYFDMVEINSSFYHIPRLTYTEGWINKVQTNPDFKFTLKLWQGFTHADNEPKKNEVDMFYQVCNMLKESGNLGGILVQFPWSFRMNDENLAKIERITKNFKDMDLIIEVRHGTWNDEKYIKFLQDNGLNFCNIDQPVIGESLAPTEMVTGNVGYVRLHGRNYEKWFNAGDEPAQRYNYLYDDKEIDSWVDRIKNIITKKVNTFVVSNNHWQGKAAHAALKIKHRIKKQKVKMPRSLSDRYSDLEAIAAEDNSIEQKELF